MPGLNRSQTFATHATAVRKDAPAAFAGVAVQKSMLPLAAHLGGLILAFHNRIFVKSGFG
jgi:hypothetical protein